MMIKQIIAARVSTEQGHTRVTIDWIDDRGRRGSTSGDNHSGHMIALLIRAEREGVVVDRS